MTNKGLVTLANKISQKYFKENVKGSVAFNSRMRTNSSNFTYCNNNDGQLLSWKISINPLVVKYFGKSGLIKNLKHQIILDYQLQNHLYFGFDASYKRIAKRINAPLYLEKLHPSTSHYYVYQCTNCLHSFIQKNKLNTGIYSCGHRITNDFGYKRICKGKLVCVGRVSGAQLRNDKHNALAQAKHRAKLFKNYKHRMFAKFE